MPFYPKALIFLLIAGTMTFFLDREERQGSFGAVDRNYRSFLMANTQEKIEEPSVTFLKIDDPGKGVFGEWPLGPVNYSILVDNLARNDPKVIALEPVMGWHGGRDEVELSTLRSSLLRLDRNEVLLGAELMQNPSGEAIRDSTLSLFPQLTKVSGDRSRVPEFTRAGALPEPALMAISPMLGFTRIDLGDSEAKRDRDSFTIPLLARHGERLVPSFILMTMVLEAGAEPGAVEVSFDEKLIRIPGGEGLEIPIDEGGRLAVHTGIREAVSKHNADILILDGEQDIRDQLEEAEREALLSRIVILGTDDEIARSIELPKNAEKISQSELFAMAIATIQAKRFIRQVPPVVEYAIWAALAGIGVWLMRARRRGGLVMRWLVLVILYIVSCMMLFQYSGQWAPLVAPVGIIASILVVGLLLPMVRVTEPVSDPPPEAEDQPAEA